MRSCVPLHEIEETTRHVRCSFKVQAAHRQAGTVFIRCTCTSVGATVGSAGGEAAVDAIGPVPVGAGVGARLASAGVGASLRAPNLVAAGRAVGLEGLKVDDDVAVGEADGTAVGACVVDVLVRDVGACVVGTGEGCLVGIAVWAAGLGVWAGALPIGSGVAVETADPFVCAHTNKA